MGRWRSKFVFTLIVYFAGFATAIYMLAPVPDSPSQYQTDLNFINSAFKSDQFARSFNGGLHKCVDFVKDLSYQAGDFLKEKWQQRKAEG